MRKICLKASKILIALLVAFSTLLPVYAEEVETTIRQLDTAPYDVIIENIDQEFLEQIIAISFYESSRGYYNYFSLSKENSSIVDNNIVLYLDSLLGMEIGDYEAILYTSSSETLNLDFKLVKSAEPGITVEELDNQSQTLIFKFEKESLIDKLGENLRIYNNDNTYLYEKSLFRNDQYDEDFANAIVDKTNKTVSVNIDDINIPNGTYNVSLGIFDCGDVKITDSFVLTQGAVPIEDIEFTFEFDDQTRDLYISSKNIDFLKNITKVYVLDNDNNRISPTYTWSKSQELKNSKFVLDFYGYLSNIPQGSNVKFAITSKGYLETISQPVYMEYGEVSSDNVQVQISQSNEEPYSFKVESEDKLFLKNLWYISLNNGDSWYDAGIYFDINEYGDKPNAYYDEEEEVVYLDHSIFGKTIEGSYTVSLNSRGYSYKTLDERLDLLVGEISSENIKVNMYQEANGDIVITSDSLYYLKNIHEIEFYNENGDCYGIYARTTTIEYDDGYVQDANASLDEENKKLTLFYDWDVNGLYVDNYDVVVLSRGYTNKSIDNFELTKGMKDPSNYEITMKQQTDEPYDVILTCKEDKNYLKNINFIAFLIPEGGEYWVDVYLETNRDELEFKNADFNESTGELHIYYDNVANILSGDYDIVINSEGYDNYELKDFTLVKGGKSIDNIEISMSQNINGTHDVIISSNNLDYLKDLWYISFYIENNPDSFEDDLAFGLSLESEYSAAYINDKNELVIPYYRLHNLAEGNYDVTLMSNEYVSMHIPDGLTINYAGCNHTEDDLIHLEKQELTCTQDGIKECYYCEECDGYLYNTDWLNDTYGKDTFITKALGHKENVVKVEKEPTCVEKGYTEEVECKVCGETITASTEIDELGHKEVTTKEAKDPTCTEAGHTKEVSCERCKEVLVESTKIEALGHKYENGKCTVCQEVETGDIDTSVEDLPTIDTSKPVEEVVVGTDEEAKDVLDETVNDIVENIISGDKVENIDEEVAEEIKQQIEAGNDVEVVTEVVVETLDEEKVDEDHIVLIVETVKGEDKDAKVVQYLDLSVLLKVMVDDKEKATSEVTELSKPMTFTVAIPEEMKEVAEGYTRIYFIVRVHNGVSETLPVTVNDDETLSFSTDKFSTYALAYKDVENSAAVTPEKAPTKTGDDTNIVLFAGLAVLAAGTMYVLRRKEEY